MNYFMLDSILKPWADSHALYIHTTFKDLEVRSIDIVSQEGKRFQLWIDEPDQAGNTSVHIWDMKKKRKDFSATKLSLKDKLDMAYREVQNWF